ncbi:MAG: ABC transporter ATP-binding protein [Candidatus Bathyarchaeia archaeon]
MTRVELKHISTKHILRDVNLTIPDGQLLALLGPTGAGKTTLLNVIAGVIDYEGSVLFDGESIDDKPAGKRNVGYVFQDLALFPHLTVYKNIAYGLKVRRNSLGEIEKRVNELLRLMKIEHLKNRYPRNLSGGERQRVALARALAFSPHILLLDEPLNNLDRYTRQYIRAEIRQIQKGFGITTIFVTHDVEEAKELGDAVAILVDGRLRQVGTFDEVFSNPADEEIANLLGSQNVLECSSYKHLWGELYEVDCKGMKIVVTCEGSVIKKISIPAREIYIYADKPMGPRLNTYKGTVLEITPLSSSITRVKIKVGENILLAELPKDIFSSLDLKVGKEVFLKLRLKSIIAFGADPTPEKVREKIKERF